MRTRFGLTAAGIPFSRRQLELIVGSLLGDATLLETTAGYAFRAHHGLEQRALVDWKYDLLRAFVRTAPRACGDGYYFRTVTHPVLTALRGTFYSEKRKIVPIDLLHDYLSPFAVAVWIMDDGAADGKQLRINTQSFTLAECESLVSLLLGTYGLEFSINTDKGKPRLRCRARSMPALVSLVEPYILPEMRYKLPG